MRPSNARGALAALIAAGVLGLADVSPARSRPCRPAGSRTMALSPQAHVYRHRGHSYACLFARNHPYRLDQVSRFDDRGDFPLAVHGSLLAGTFAAYVLQGRTTGGEVESSVHSLNLRTGRLRSRNALSDQASAEGEETEYVRRLFLKPNGSIAWSADAPAGQSAEVAKLDPGFTLLDQGPEPALSPASMRLSGSTLTWQDAGTTRTASLN
jgi:hypothetical protein